MSTNKLLVTLNVEELKTLINESVVKALAKSKPSSSENQHTKQSELISRIEVCNLFKISKTTIDKWRKFKILPPEVKISTRVYFERDKIIEFINNRRKRND